MMIRMIRRVVMMLSVLLLMMMTVMKKRAIWEGVGAFFIRVKTFFFRFWTFTTQ